ncbi:MAG: NUDIX hydrolase [Acutalibacteraceae bacterium]
MDISFNTGIENNNNMKFNFRAAAIITRNSKVLIVTDEDINHYYFVGGRVKMLETTQQTIMREIKEELHISAETAVLSIVNENFFEINGIDYHEIAFVYKVKLKDGNLLPCEDEFDMTDTDGVIHHFKFADIDEIERLPLLPYAIRDKIREAICSEQIIHTVNIDMEG